MIKNKIIISLIFLNLAGCASIQNGIQTVQKYWPKDHDPVMFDRALSISMDIDALNCDNPNFDDLIYKSHFLARYAELRKDPQYENLNGLHQHFEKLKSNPKKIFCTFGKTTAKDRMNIVLTSWSKR
ncbi:hypothetical protein EB118_20955 [bacterium]|nr:hypothetical protein [bacterium]